MKSTNKRLIKGETNYIRLASGMLPMLIIFFKSLVTRLQAIIGR